MVPVGVKLFKGDNFNQDLTEKRGNFRELLIWKKAKDLAVFVYKMTLTGDFSKDFGLRDQIRRAAVSVPSNIAEGDNLGTDKQSVRHFYYARGSAAEILTQAIIASEIGYMTTFQFNHIETECQAISGMLTRLIQARTK